MKSLFLALLILSSFSTKVNAQSRDCSRVPIEQASECFSKKRIIEKSSDDDNNYLGRDVAIITWRACKMWSSGEFTQTEIIEETHYLLVELLVNYDRHDENDSDYIHALNIYEDNAKEILNLGKQLYLKTNCSRKFIESYL